jgi:hypothetical protein
MNKAVSVVALFAVLPLVSCGWMSKGPGDTLLEMHKKMCDAKSFQPMVEYTAPQSQAIVATVLAIADDPKKGPEMKENLESGCKAGIKVLSEKIDGDSAVVTLSSDKKPTDMIKIDGKWKMVISKK